jgi:hypothetical protein
MMTPFRRAGARPLEGLLRLLIAAFMFAALTPGAALASSFVTIAPPKQGDTPSIMVIGSAAGPAQKIAGFLEKLMRLSHPQTDGERPRVATVSPSIVAFDAEPPVTMEKVAAIGKRQSVPEPMVMRGGVAGGAFSTPEAPADVASVPDKPAQEEAAPKDASSPEAGGNAGAMPEAGETMAEKRAPPPASAPTSSPPQPAQPPVQREGPKPQ